MKNILFQRNMFICDKLFVSVTTLLHIILGVRTTLLMLEIKISHFAIIFSCTVSIEIMYRNAFGDARIENRYFVVKARNHVAANSCRTVPNLCVSHSPPFREVTLNVMAPGRYTCHFECAKFEHQMKIGILSIQINITLQYQEFISFMVNHLGSDIGQLSSGNKQLLEPIMWKISDAIWLH